MRKIFNDGAKSSTRNYRAYFQKFHGRLASSETKLFGKKTTTRRDFLVLASIIDSTYRDSGSCQPDTYIADA